MLAVGSFIADRKEAIICIVFMEERARCSRSDPTEDASMHQRILLSTSCESPKANRKRKDPSYTILYYTILYSTLLYSTLLYSTLLYSTLLYYTILYCTILYFTILYCVPAGLVHGSGHTAPFQQGQNPPQRTLAFEKCEKSPRLPMVWGDELVSGVKCSSVRGKMLQRA